MSRSQNETPGNRASVVFDGRSASPLPTSQMRETWDRVLSHPQAGTSDLRYLHSVSFMLVDRIEALEKALREQLAADDALTAFVIAADPTRLGEIEWRLQHAERSERRRVATLAARALLSPPPVHGEGE